jgi:hypothetical protein
MSQHELSSIRTVPFDREKYMGILHSEGLHPALTALHHDLEQWEREAFEDGKGFQPQLWEDLKLIRNFSRDLWNTARGDQPRT